MHCQQCDGWNYHFQDNPHLRNNDALRAGFLQYQTYPENTVEGRATLTRQNGVPGKYWAITQQPQLIANIVPVISAFLGGATPAGGIIFQPLIDTSASIG